MWLTYYCISDFQLYEWKCETDTKKITAIESAMLLQPVNGYLWTDTPNWVRCGDVCVATDPEVDLAQCALQDAHTIPRSPPAMKGKFRQSWFFFRKTISLSSL